MSAKIDNKRRERGFEKSEESLEAAAEEIASTQTLESLPLKILRRPPHRPRPLLSYAAVAQTKVSPLEIDVAYLNAAFAPLKKWLEGGDDTSKERLAIEEHEEASPCKFFDAFIMKGIIVDRIEHGRVLCSMKVTPRLTNDTGNFMHSGAVASLVDLIGSAVFFSTGSPTSGVSTDISISDLDAAYVHDETVIEAKVLHMGK